MKISPPVLKSLHKVRFVAQSSSVLIFLFWTLNASDRTNGKGTTKVVVFVVVDRFGHYMHTDDKIQNHDFRRPKKKISSMPDTVWPRFNQANLLEICSWHVIFSF